MSLRNEILQVSRKILLDEGFSNISMRKIAGKINVSATSIYLHFKNKDHLLHSIIEESIRELNNTIQSISSSALDPVQKMERIARSYIAFGLDRPQEYEVIFMVRPEEMPRYPIEKFRDARKGYELLASVIREGIQQDLIDEQKALPTAYSMWAQLHGIVSVIINKRLDTRLAQNEFINHAVDHIVQGVLVSRRSTASI